MSSLLPGTPSSVVTVEMVSLPFFFRVTVSFSLPSSTFTSTVIS